MMDALRDRLRGHLDATHLIPAGTRLLVGVSGGADSVCLLHLLQGLGVDVVAAHLHHGQRVEAELELELVAAFCQALSVPFTSGRADVPRMALELKIGLEEAGRYARYDFLKQAAQQTECALIATAHTRDDLLETQILNLARGSGLAGLAGIPERRGNVVRPLLGVDRAETRAYCEALGLWYHDDPANLDPTFARSRVRLRVVPELESLNPAVREAGARLARLAAEEDRYLDGIAAAALEHCEIALNGSLAFLTRDLELAFRRETLAAIHAVVRRRGVRLASEFLGAELPFDLAQALCDVLPEGGSGAVTAPGGAVVLEWDADMLHVRRLGTDAPFRFPLTIPGETEAETFGWKFVAHPTETCDVQREPRSLDVVLDQAATQGGLFFRSVEPGDKMAPLGMSGSRKLSDLLGEVGLTAGARKRLPLVCDMVGPVWAPGVALADRVKVTPDTRRPLRIALEPVQGAES